MGLSARAFQDAGGSLRDIIISGVFPALAWLTIVLVVLSFAVSLGHSLEAVIAPVGPVGLITVLVVIPGACLLLGVLVDHAAAKRWTKSAA
jgi:vacuolar-type H+-ATPase subunit I/STV1